MTEKPMITVNTAARMSGLTPSTIRQALRRGAIKGDRDGRPWLIDTKDFKRWLNDPDAHKTGPK